ncbi:MAG: hypothetical protein ACT4P5_23155 [Armatimonadota bacterium]
MAIEPDAEQSPQLALVEIAGSPRQISSIEDNPGMILSRGSGYVDDDGQARVTGYVTDQALEAVLKTGCSVRVIMTKEQVTRHWEVTARQVDGGERTSLIEIQAPLDALRPLDVIPGLRLEPHYAERLNDARWKVTAEATPEAIAQIQGLGLSVTIVIAEDEMTRRRAQFFGDEEE